MLALLGFLAGCGGGGGGGKDAAPIMPTKTAPTLKSIEVTPSLPTAAAGTTVQFTATGIYSDNSKQNLTAQVAWASSAVAVATVSSGGLATAASAGNVAVSATSGAVSGETTLTVTNAILVSIEVSPPVKSIANGLKQQFSAIGHYSDNSTQDLTAQVTWASSAVAVATVSSSGLATAAGVGSTSVAAASGAVSGEATLTVTDATLASIEVSPTAKSLANGLTQQFTAIGRYTDNSTQDLTAQVAWASSAVGVATVSNSGLATAVGAGSTTVSAARGGVSGATTLAVTDATLVSIEVSPTAKSLANGLTQQFSAIGHYSDNSTKSLTAQVTWSSSEPAVATVSNATDSNGLATTVRSGSTTVSATSGSVSGTTTLTVTDAALMSIEVSPTAKSIANGLTQQFMATGRYTDNSVQDLTTQVTWTSSAPAVATVSNADGLHGLATAASAGSTTVSAASGSVTGEATLTVTDATLVSIAVTPTAKSIANGLTRQFTATGIYTDDSTQDLTTLVTWTSSAPAVATVSNADGLNGLATAVGAGATTVTATSGDLTGTTTMTVTDATLVSIEVSPPVKSIANGLTQQFAATGIYTDSSTRDLTTLVTWASSDTAVATVSNADGLNGLATAANTGSITVSATSGELSGAATLTVTNATLVSIDVTASTLSIANGLTQQFTATGHYTDNSAQDITEQVTWASTNAAVATVSNAAGSTGHATAVGAGTTSVTATNGVVSGAATLTVTNATLVSIDVSAVTLSIANGLTLPFTAMGHYTDNSTQDITTQVTWDSTNAAVATVSNAAGSTGLATAVGAGTTTVTATNGAVSGGTTLTVTNATLVSIDVFANNLSIANGLTQQFTAMGHYTDNSTQDITTQVTWASANAPVATVSNASGSNGLATAVAPGSTAVSATSGAVSGETTLTVTNATLVSIAVSPTSSSIPNGLSQLFTAFGTYTDNTTLDLTESVTWSSSAPAVAAVSNATGSKGVATALNPGSTTVSATSGTVSDAATLTVTSAAPTGAQQLLDALRIDVHNVGPGKSLEDKLSLVKDYLDRPDIVLACGKMNDVKQQLTIMSGHQISVEQAVTWTVDANQIMAAIPCTP